MKILSRILSVLAIASVALFNTGCGSKSNDSDPVEKVQLAKLSKTWSIDAANGAMLETTDRTSDFPGFTLTIGGSFNDSDHKGPYNYSTSGPTTMPKPSPWSPTGGTWTFSSVDADGNGGTIATSDNIAITYKFTSSGLQLKFNCAACNFNARTSQVNGNWVFNLH